MSELPAQVDAPMFTMEEALEFFEPCSRTIYNRFPSLKNILDIQEFMSSYYIHLIESGYLQKYGSTVKAKDYTCTKFFYLFKGMRNRAVDLLRNSSRQRLRIVSDRVKNDSGEDLSLYDLIPDPNSINVLGELILQEAIDILPKDRKHRGGAERHPEFSLHDILRRKVWSSDGSWLWVEEKSVVATVWYCHYWIYYLHLQDWSNSEISELFKVSATRIHQMIRECLKYLKGHLLEERCLYNPVWRSNNFIQHKKTVKKDRSDEYFAGWVDIPKEIQVAVLQNGKKMDLSKVKNKDNIVSVITRKLSKSEREELGIQLIKENARKTGFPELNKEEVLNEC